MDVIIRKVGVREGKERFVLINAQTESLVTAKDASETTIRKYFQSKGLAKSYLDDCFQRARNRYATPSGGNDSSTAVSQPTDDELLSELGLDN